MEWVHIVNIEGNDADDQIKSNQNMNNKVLAKLDTNNFRDAVNTGYTFTLYADGRVSALYHSRWQGSRDGARYTTDPGYVDLSSLDESDPDSDAEALLTMAVQHVQPSEDREWRQTRRGHIVK